MGEQIQMPIRTDESYLRAKEYFERNPAFLRGVEMAAGVMQRRMGKVSARGLMEFARWFRRLGTDGMYELLSCFEVVGHINGEEVAAMPNAYSAYLTRHLEELGYDVTKAKSRMDS